MVKIKYNIHYGTKDIEKIFEVLINDKINEVTRDIKMGKITGYECNKNNIATNSKREKQVARR